MCFAYLLLCFFCWVDYSICLSKSIAFSGFTQWCWDIFGLVFGGVEREDLVLGV